MAQRGRPRTFDREAALRAAVVLFWRHGYEGTSIAMLTDAVGVTPPTLYAAFGSKEELYREALAAFRGDERSAALVGGSLFQTLAAFLHRQARRFADPTSPRGCMVATGTLRAGEENRSAADLAAGHRSDDLALFVRLLGEAKARGELDPDAAVAAVARFYIAVVQGMSVQAIDGASADELVALADVALAAWPRGPAFVAARSGTTGVP